MADATADLTAIEARATEELNACADESAARAWNTKFFGDKGEVNAALGASGRFRRTSGRLTARR